MKFSIRSKLFLLLTGLAAVVLAGVLTSVSHTLTAAISNKITTDFRRSDLTFRREQSLQYTNLRDAADLIGENSTFIANVELDDPDDAYLIVEWLSGLATVDLFIVTNHSGSVLAWLGDPDRHGEDLTHRQSVEFALEGGGDLEEEGPELWHVGDDLFQVASVPIWKGGDTVIGALVLGTRITEVEALQLKGESQTDITFVVDDQLIASTIESLTGTELKRLQQKWMAEVDQVVSSGDTEASPVIEAQFAGNEVFAFISRLGSDIGDTGYYIATVERSLELAILTELQTNIVATAGISLAITIALALVLGRRMSRPIMHLVEGMNQVTSGNLRVSLKPTTRDEIGLLTSTFNDMIVNLRERLQLLKYVGSHTMDMIRDGSEEEVPLGGSRRELAVLFTDIRGFTPYSEKRSPEEVISMLNRYLGFQAEIVPTYGGSIDKFVGDEMMALFIGEDALQRAIDCAVEIQRRVKVEHDTDDVPLDIGVGVNFGPVILGNMGAQNRLDYTAIGAAVNLGARLMQVAAPGQILVPQSLLAGLEEEVPVKELHKIAFKGFSEEMEVAELSWQT